jgi:NSS family neurotransmitter:Na+ symporter
MATGATPSTRDSWATHAGFLLAAVGSAVGLGNMWRFSYIASQGGGAAFIIAYLVLVAVIGIPLMTSEFIVGRMTQVSPAKALRELGGTAWSPLGWLFVFCGFGILSYYSVIAGWTMRYAIVAIGTGIPAETGEYFGEVSQGTDALIGHLVFIALTVFVVVGGVKHGIERAAVILMPVLFLLLIGLAVWAFTLPGSREGYSNYLDPSFGELFNRRILTDAAGQAFFSLSLGMGALMTYASYIRDKRDLGREATIVATCDFGVAFLAGLVVFPIIFSFGLTDQVGESSVGALFISLPAGFSSMGVAGKIVGTTFFIMLLFAALTSSISLLEVVVAAFIDGLGWTRKKATITLGAVAAALGIPSAYSTNFLGAADAVIGNFLLIVGGLLTSIFVGYVILPKADAELAQGLESPLFRKGWAIMVRYVVPLILAVVCFFLIAPTWAAIQTMFGAGG